MYNITFFTLWNTKCINIFLHFVLLTPTPFISPKSRYHWQSRWLAQSMVLIHCEWSLSDLDAVTIFMQITIVLIYHISYDIQERRRHVMQFKYDLMLGNENIFHWPDPNLYLDRRARVQLLHVKVNIPDKSCDWLSVWTTAEHVTAHCISGKINNKF